MEYIYETLQVHAWHWDDVSWTRKTTLACLVFELSARVQAITPKPYGIYLWKFTDACMTLRWCVMNMEDNSLLIWFINYLPLTKFHTVNRVWAISTLIKLHAVPVTITYVTFFWVAFWQGHPCPMDTFSSFHPCLLNKSRCHAHF